MTVISIMIYNYGNREKDPYPHFRLHSINLWPYVASMLPNANLTYAITIFILYFLIFSNYWEAFSCLNLYMLISHNNSERYIFTLSFYRGGNKLLKWNNLAELTWLVRGRTRIQTQTCLTPEFFHLSCCLYWKTFVNTIEFVKSFSKLFFLLESRIPRASKKLSGIC